jgi:Kef-type K+ transport system membrane component KefB
MPGVSDLIRLTVFLGCAHVSGRVASALRVSTLIGHLLTGALLGPPLANFVPQSGTFELAGLLGVQLCVVDAGLGTDLKTLRVLAPRATAIAVLGISFPIVGALCIVAVSDVVNSSYSASGSLRAGAAVGAAIAPTSLGVVSKLLTDAGELTTPLGQLISVSAVVDDTLSLMLLTILTSLAQESPSAWSLSRPVVLGFVFIVGAVSFSALLPSVMQLALKPVPVASHSQVSLSLLLTAAIALTYAANAAGTSFLIAGYFTGVAFAATSSELSTEPWRTHVSPLIPWLFLLFFASTIGFSIPIGVLFKSSALVRGLLLAFAAIVGKFACGLAVPRLRDDGIAVAVSMQGRGDFGFLIAAESFKLGLIDEDLYAATVWGVLVPTLLTPLVLPLVFKKRKACLERRAVDVPFHGNTEILDTETPTSGTTDDARRDVPVIGMHSDEPVKMQGR